MLTKIDEAADHIRSRTALEPKIAIILGSGLGGFADRVEADAIIPYREIPHAAASNVAGHSGRMIIGQAAGVPVLVMQGRVHFYEGYSMEEVVFLARVAGRLGVSTAIVTNAAGGVNTSYAAGDLMLISDHINMLGTNPLRGQNFDELGPRFPDMSEVYPSELRRLAREVSERISV
ncbi:MAG TPA: purine-nucleoside phosphorylase, partial [Thermoanaerobaculia bacterium]|nr:purine-nucleoside phosphorylase [Thermoanaerobaculia bacterium]